MRTIHETTAQKGAAEQRGCPPPSGPCSAAPLLRGSSNAPDVDVEVRFGIGRPTLRLLTAAGRAFARQYIKGCFHQSARDELTLETAFHASVVCELMDTLRVRYRRVG